MMLRRSIAVAAAALAVCASAPAAAGAAPLPGSKDAAAEAYEDLLLQHTRWQETTWDEAAGHYRLADFAFTGVLGHAVLLTLADYDPGVTGVSRATLHDRTVRTIAHFATTNRWVDPNGDWGGQIFWDSTFESYFVAAAKLMWDDLDAVTRANVDRIVRGEADYVASLEDREDPRSAGWSSNGLLGAFRNDSKIEEMGAKSMPLAVGVAHASDDARAGVWREWLNRWSLSLGGLPPADRANPTLVDGRPVFEWTRAHNIWDSFIVENHNAIAPMYQESIGAYPGRNAAHFVIAGRPLPDALRMLPNERELAATLEQIGTRAGVAADLMVADRHHLYGRNVLPLAYRSAVLGDRRAARAEGMLLGHLGPYVAYPPADRLTKFSGEPKYEPEARAELAMAFVLHWARGAVGGGAKPVSERAYFAGRAGAVHYGDEVGLVAHQTSRALAASVWKPNYVKFAYVPGHDDWFLDFAGTAPSLLPSTRLAVTGVSAHEYDRRREGFDASATVLRTAGGAAGFATLPGGQAVYATTGLGRDEGALRLHNLSMPGVPGLDGDRTFSAASGRATLAPTPGLGDGGVDDVRFPATTARYVRMLGAEPATQFGYSLFELEVRAGDGDNLALGRPATASSYDAVAPPGPFEPRHAVDGDPATRWAVSRAERGRADSWVAVDLGAARSLDRVVLRWESAFGRGYRVQVSDDGQSWRDVATVPEERTFTGSWLNVDGRAGFVVRGSGNPIRATATSVALSAGPAEGAAGLVVEARPAEAPARTAAAAATPTPSGGPPALRASLAGGHLTLFNLGAEALDGADVRLPAPARLFRGVQRARGGGTVYEAKLGAFDGLVEAPRFAVRAGASAPLRFAVADSHAVHVEHLGGRGSEYVQLESLSTGERRSARIAPGRSTTLRFRAGPRTPSADLARARITYPTSPLPVGMSDPDAAVDGDRGTSWRPGGGGRMVVDLGTNRELGRVAFRWTNGRARTVRVELSDDGLSYRPAGAGTDAVTLSDRARYVAIVVEGWRPTDARLSELEVAEP